MDTEIVVDHQKHINILMNRYEDTTRKMLDCSTDDIFLLTEKRKSISEAVSKLDVQILNECGNNDVALSAYKNKCARDELSDEFKQVFDLRQEFNSIAFRISSLEPEIKQRIKILRDNLVVKIKKNNSSQDAKAAKYASNVSGSGEFFVPKNKKMI